jgi:lysophospholipase L1-like esterase
MMRLRFASSLLAGLLLAGCSTPAPAWRAGWGAALMPPSAKTALAQGELRDVTLRQTVRLSLGGQALRVRVSFGLGAEPVVIGAATLAAPPAAGGSGVAGPATPLRFQGAPGVTVAPGAEALSDPLTWQAVAGTHLTVSLHVRALPARQSVHVAAHSTQFLAPGDQSAAEVLEGGRQLSSWYQLGAVEVDAPQAGGVLVAIGDSITDGSGSGRDRAERWTDYLVRRLQREGGPAIAVVNAGIGGNRMLRDDIGPHLLSRFERDVLGRAGVTHALVLIGVNDLGRMQRSQGVSPETRQAMLKDLQAGWRRLLEAAHARGVCLFAGTLTPYGASRLYRPGPQDEADRVALNRWLRESGLFDGIADFDAAVRDPAVPDRLLPAYDSGDGLHLSPAGYRAMAGAVPLERLTGCARRR